MAEATPDSDKPGGDAPGDVILRTVFWWSNILAAVSIVAGASFALTQGHLILVVLTAAYFFVPIPRGWYDLAIALGLVVIGFYEHAVLWTVLAVLVPLVETYAGWWVLRRADYFTRHPLADGSRRR